MPGMLAAPPPNRPEVEYASVLDLTRLKVFRFLVRRQASSQSPWRRSLPYGLLRASAVTLASNL